RAVHEHVAARRGRRTGTARRSPLSTQDMPRPEMTGPPEPRIMGAPGQVPPSGPGATAPRSSLPLIAGAVGLVALVGIALVGARALGGKRDAAATNAVSPPVASSASTAVKTPPPA